MKTICRKWKLRFVLITLFTLVLNSFTAFADIKHLMINTDSNALMTLELDDSDYLVSPLSTLGTVSNTIENDSIQVRVYYYNSTNGQTSWVPVECPLVNGRYQLNYSVLPGRYITLIQPILYSDDMPSPGSYRFSMDYASDFAYDYKYASFGVDKTFSNAALEHYDLSFPFEWFSGDIYISPKGVNVSPIWRFMSTFAISGDSLTQVGGSFSFHFERVNPDSSFQSMGADTSASDYQNDVSSSLSDLSSSVDTMTDEISGVTEAIQNLQGAMEPHYSNVLTQLHHITEQLHAFYDQIYNNIHLKEYALWQDIKTAIENIDLEVNVNLDKLKTSIDNMSQAVQNKLQSVTDTITGGYNNSGMQEDNNELSGALDELDNAEQEVLDDVNGYIEGFEYPSFDGISSGIIGALSFFGGFLHSIFLGMGEFGLIITFSLTMIFVLIIVGYHRIRS